MLCAQGHADEEAGWVTSPHIVRHESRPDDLRAAMRACWKGHKPKPVVRTSRRSQPDFGVPGFSEHVSIAKRGMSPEMFISFQSLEGKFPKLFIIQTRFFDLETFRFNKKADLGISNLAIEGLDSYDAHFQPLLSAIQGAQDSRNRGHLPVSTGAPTPAASAFPPTPQVERDIHYDVTRDPRIKDP
ncbi:hypothetical protein BDR22DRAFT_821041 [Usnea florida]